LKKFLKWVKILFFKKTPPIFWRFFLFIFCFFFQKSLFIQKKLF